ncbi:MAG: hypothetical protein DMG85_06375 [Acidobacteria bacterium]|nr:MAG: hypothetical protein DMG85_06375 [Acidobacteriota bacterium]
MISIVFVFMGVVTAVAVFAILAKTCAGEPKRAEKWEKGEIIKQLLALSEGENSVSVIASPSPGSLRLASASATRNDTLRRGTYREHNSKPTYSPMNPNPPIPLRPNLTEVEIEERIHQRAYELYQGRGGADGNATDDWLQAKKEVLSYKAKAATTSS